MATKKVFDKEEEEPFPIEETTPPDKTYDNDDEFATDLTEEELVASVETVEDGPVEDIDGLPDGWAVRAVDGQYHVEHLNTSIVVITDRDSILEVIDQLEHDNPETFEPG